VCIVSAVGDNFRDTFPEKYPWYPTTSPNTYPPSIIPTSVPTTVIPVTPDLSKFATKEDIEDLRKTMEELKLLLKAAIRYDEMTQQRECETAEKIALIKQVAEAVGVDLSDLHLGEKKED